MPFAIVAAQIVLVSALSVWLLRSRRTKLLLAALPVVVAGFSAWWMAVPEANRDGPQWFAPVFVTLFALGTVATASMSRRHHRASVHFGVTMLGAVLSAMVAPVVTFLIWGLQGAL